MEDASVVQQTGKISSQGDVMPKQESFSVLPAEQVVIDGAITYRRSALSNIYVTCYVTDKRFVICGFPPFLYHIIGPILGFAAMFTKLKKVLVQYSWGDVASIKKDKVLGIREAIVISTKDGQQHTILPGSKKDHWFLAISESSGIKF